MSLLYFLCLLLLLYVLLRPRNYYRGPLSDHFDGKHFFNPWEKNPHTFADLLRWKSSATPKPWPTQVASHSNQHLSTRLEGDQLRVTFIGHSTVLIQTEGFNLLTDPVWSQRASPFPWYGPKRVIEPGIPLEALPPIDLILISHNHYDHLDLTTLQKLWKRHKPLIVTPLGNDSIINSFDSSISVKTLDWECSCNFSPNVSLHLEPTQHWSSRYILDRNKALWGAFVIRTPSGTLYFAGDTGYDGGALFQKARAAFGSFRLALLPIGAYEPRWFMKYGHMNPEEAVLVHKELGAPYTMAVHFGTFRLSDESYEDPLLDLAEARRKYGVSEERFRALKIGESWDIPV